MKYFVKIPIMLMVSFLIAGLMIVHVVFGMAGIGLQTLGKAFSYIAEITIDGVVDSINFVDNAYLREKKDDDQNRG